MSSGSGDSAGALYNIITQESAGLHLSASELETFRIYVRWAYKPGAYTCTYTTTTAHRTQGGWARIPFMDSAGNMTQREYVLGTFVNNCTDTAAAGVAYTAY